MSLVHKVLDFTLTDPDPANRSFWAVASTETVDRQGDSIAADGWEFANFLKNPVIPWAHDYTAPPVAQALAVKVEAGRLMFQARFATAEDYPFADTIYRLYQGGFLRAFSVGFEPIAAAPAPAIPPAAPASPAGPAVAGRSVGGTRYLRQELYEISCVTLPANPEALTQGGKHLKHLLEPSLPTPGQLGLSARAVLTGRLLDGLILSRLRGHLAGR